MRQRYEGLHRLRFSLPCHPMLVIHGDVDGALQVENAETVANALPPGSRVAIIPGAGHFSELDQPAAVCDAILDYLNHDSG